MPTQIPDDYRLKLLDAFDDDKVASFLGLSRDDVPKLRADPLPFLANPVISARLSSFTEKVINGQLMTEEEEKANIFVKSLEWIYQKPVAKQVFDLLGMYNRNIASPITGITVDLINRILPGDQQIEKRRRELTAKGIRYDRATIEAFKQSTMPGWVKFGIEFFTDPAIVGFAVGKGLGLASKLTANAATVAAAHTIAGRRFIPLRDISEFVNDLPVTEPNIIRRTTGRFTNPSLAIVKGTVEAVKLSGERATEVGRSLIDFTNSNLRGVLKKDAISNTGLIKLTSGATTDFRQVIASPGNFKGVVGEDVIRFAEEWGRVIKEANEELIANGLDVAQIGPTRHILSYKKFGRELRRTRDFDGFEVFEQSQLFKEMNDMLRRGHTFDLPEEYMQAVLNVTYDNLIGEGVRKELIKIIPAGTVAAQFGARALKQVIEKEVPVTTVVSTKTGKEIVKVPTQLPARLPSSLAQSKPKYNIGQTSFDPIFESDIDKALFIVAQPIPSKRNQEFLAWLRNFFPDKTDKGLQVLGQDIRGQIKVLAMKRGTGGALSIPTLMFTKGTLPQRVGELGDVVGSRVITKATTTTVETVVPTVMTNVELAAKIEKTFGSEGGRIVKVLEQVAKPSDAIRTFRTTADVGAPFIHGQILMFKNPLIWANSTRLMFQSLLDPQVLSRYIRQNALDTADFIGHEGILNTPDVLHALQAGGYLAKVVRIPAIGPLFGRAQVAFETFLDVAKIETWKALKTTAARHNQLDALAAHVNKLVGTISSVHLGVGYQQRLAERALFFFSPQYTRAITGLLIDIFQGGLRGDEARKAIAALMFGGAAFHAAFASALGQEPNFDPSDGKFMTVRVGGINIGPGGKMRNLMRLAGNMSEKPLNEVGDYFHWNVFDSKVYQDNPLAQWLRSGSAPVAGFAMNMVLGEDVLGRPIPEPGEDLIPWAAYVLKENIPPFWIPAIVEAAGQQGQFDAKAGLISGGGESLGLLTFPVSERDKLKELRDKLAKEEHQKKWEELPSSLKSRLRESHPELVDQMEQANTEALGFRSSKRRAEYQAAIDKEEKIKIEKFQRAAKDFMSGGTPTHFRSAIAEAQAEQRRRTQDLRVTFDDAVREREEFKQRPAVLENLLPYDVALQEWFDIQASATKEDGTVDYELKEALEATLEQKWGKELVGLIKDDLAQRRLFSSQGQMPEIVQEFFSAREILKPYWNVYKNILTDKDLELYKVYVRASVLQKEQLVLSQPRLEILIGRVTLAQEQLRMKNEEIDEALIKFYGFVPKHLSNIRKYRNIS